MRAGNDGSGRVAGPLTTAPAVVNREPWQGQSRLRSGGSGSSTVHPSCVQVRETATTEVADVRVTARARSESNSARVSPTAGSGTRIVRGAAGGGVSGPLTPPEPPQAAPVAAAPAARTFRNAR